MFQAGVFNGMSDLEKYKIYKKAQMMLAIKKIKEEEKAMEQMVAEDEALDDVMKTARMEDLEASEAMAQAAVKQPVKRRLRKRIMKPQQQ